MIVTDDILSEEETEKLFSRTVSSLCFIYGQKPSEMIFVLQETGNFDELLILCLVSKEIEIPVKELYLMTEREREEIRQHRKKVIQLWKKEEDISVASVKAG